MKNMLQHLEVSDVPKSGADYTHVITRCQPIFTSDKHCRLSGFACKKLVRKERLELSHR